MMKLRRRLLFWLGIGVLCTLPFLVFHWAIAATLLVLLALALSGPLTTLWQRINQTPIEPEYSSYEEGYQEHPVLYRRPYNVAYVPSSDTPGEPKEESLSEFEPTSQYPKMLQ